MADYSGQQQGQQKGEKSFKTFKFFYSFQGFNFFLDYSTQNGGQAGDNTGQLINSTEIGNEGKMFIGGLSKSTTTESLKAYFEG